MKCKVSQIPRLTRTMTLQTRRIFTKRYACHSQWHSYNVPRLSHKLHIVTTWSSPDTAIRQETSNTTCLKCCACHAKWRWTRHKVPPKSCCETFVTSNSDHFCSTSHRHPWRPHCGRLRKVADGREERLRTWKRRRANASQPPDPQSKTRSLRYAFRKKLTPPSLSLPLKYYIDMCIHYM
jgi:hypothetical protein